MPFGIKPQCSTCKTDKSHMWRRLRPSGTVLCNSCSLKGNHVGSGATSPVNVVVPAVPTPPSSNNGNGGEENKQPSISVLPAENNVKVKEHPRRSTRNIRNSKYKQSSGASHRHISTKGKNRRVVFKRNPVKSSESVATVVTSDNIFSKGVFYQVGDIVSVMDVDGGLYYAQLKGFMQDQFCQKSAILTWILPTQQSPRQYFDPSTYIIGPEEDMPRSMEYMEFVCHAPSDYFKPKNSPYPVLSKREEKGFIWTNIKPARPPSSSEIFGGKD